MGLAAGQARLLTITARKSDCEFQSMRLSHQKISLARELADISNEYQNSLNQTTLIYDYNGTGDTSMQFNYGIMMQPSQLNNYMPMMLTDSSNRVVLNSKYAAAARNAGIPQEGLGTLPSESVRNAFIQELYGQGIILEDLSKRIQGLPYNQNAGFGGDVTVVTRTEEITFSQLKEKLSNTTASMENRNVKVFDEKGDEQIHTVKIYKDVGQTKNDGTYNLADLLSTEKEKQTHLDYFGPKGECSPIAGLLTMQEMLIEENGFIDWLYKSFSEVLDLGDGGVSELALKYACEQTKKLVANPDEFKLNENNLDYVKSNTDPYDYSVVRAAWKYEVANAGDTYDEATQYGDYHHIFGSDHNVGTQKYWENNHNTGNIYHAKDLLNPVGCHIGGLEADEARDKMGSGKIENDVYTQSQDYLGFLFSGENKKSDKQSNISINLNNIAQAFLTYYTIMANGIENNKGADGQDIYKVVKGACNDNPTSKGRTNYNKFVNKDTKFTIKLGTDISSDDLALATFYDAMFNQICANGWTEDENVKDPNYLQQMLQSGMMFISKIKDDNYYYQANYATDTYIKEIADEKLIAKAEAKYNTEKAKLNTKEETLDLKMKNLDTEISSLTTEYDTVKNTISKQIEKCFKRFNA